MESLGVDYATFLYYLKSKETARGYSVNNVFIIPEPSIFIS